MKSRLEQVHEYWFGHGNSDLEIIEEKGKLWFGKDALVDLYISAQFLDLVVLASAEQIKLDNLSAGHRLAVILLLDQFTRNIYRNEPLSFAADPLALALAKRTIQESGDLYRPIEKVFLYLPLEHSENLEDQILSVEHFQKLYDSVAENTKGPFAGFLDYAVRHYEIIARFGRFPHRNKILGRISTDEEIAFLSQPGSSF